MKISYNKIKKTGTKGGQSSLNQSYGGDGLPYRLSPEGEYVIDNTIRVNKDVIAYSADSNVIIDLFSGGDESLIDPRELNLYQLNDVNINNQRTGSILIFDGQHWSNFEEIEIDGGKYKGF